MGEERTITGTLRVCEGDTQFVVHFRDVLLIYNIIISTGTVASDQMTYVYNIIMMAFKHAYLDIQYLRRIVVCV